jgi:predicted Fe-Mo cluster-binding NifX family protein
MKIALPVENGMLCGHFGHAPQFAFVEIRDNRPQGSELKTPPPHEPGVLPKWLAEMGATHIICGGIGARAVELLEGAGIKVIAGVASMDPSRAVEGYLDGSIKPADGPTCGGHGDGEHSCHH